VNVCQVKASRRGGSDFGVAHDEPDLLVHQVPG
jgi:hypothetical protein